MRIKMIDKLLSIIENDKLGNFLDKIKGAYFGILAGITQIIMLIVGSILLNAEEPMSIGSHWVSSFGGATQGAQYVFIICMSLTIVFCIPFVLDLLRKMMPGNEKQRWMLVFPLLISLLVILGGVGLTIFNMREFSIIHVVFATIFFVSAALLVFFISFIMLFNSEIPKWQGLVGLICCSLYLLFLLPFIPVIMSGTDLVFLITDLGPTTWYFRVTEWISIIALVGWFIESGVFLLKKF